VNRQLANGIAIAALSLAAATTVFVLGALILYVVWNGIGQLSLQFIFGFPHGVNAEGGIFPTIVATIYVTALAMIIVTPVAILAAVYLTEYAHQGRLVRTIRFAADSLAGIPSIVMGLFGLAFFVEYLHLGFSMISGALALAFLMLPIVMRTTEEAIRAVPRYIRWGSYGLGATKWQTVRRVVLPAAAPRILTGIILATGRAVGETAVVIFTMGTAIYLPIWPWDPGRSMTVHLYILSTEGINLNAAYGTALLLMIMILAFNLTANWLVNRSRRLYE
jgi:phosphate transport system permease protein